MNEATELKSIVRSFGDTDTHQLGTDWHRTARNIRLEQLAEQNNNAMEAARRTHLVELSKRSEASILKAIKKAWGR